MVAFFKLIRSRATATSLKVKFHDTESRLQFTMPLLFLSLGFSSVANVIYLDPVSQFLISAFPISLVFPPARAANISLKVLGLLLFALEAANLFAKAGIRHF